MGHAVLIMRQGYLLNIQNKDRIPREDGIKEKWELLSKYGKSNKVQCPRLWARPPPMPYSFP